MASEKEIEPDGIQKDPAWKKAMQSNAMKAAMRISKKLSAAGKSGFDEASASKLAGFDAISGIKSDVSNLLDEQQLRLGSMIGKKTTNLADAIARERVEKFFKKNVLIF
jgi:hypothetical protein